MLSDLRILSNRLREILLEKKDEHRAEAQRIAAKIRALIVRLRNHYSKKQLRNVLGGLAFIFGLAASPNVNGQSFASPQTNPFGLSAVTYLASPAMVDIDNDGDLDLFVSEVYGTIKYFQNTGSSTSPQFAAPVSNPFGISINSYYAFPTFADIDGDGDQDMLVGEYNASILYLQNTGTATNPQFAAPVTNPFGITSGYFLAFPTLADVDGDGDLDLLVGGYEYIYPPYYNFPSLRFFRNNGSSTNPSFQEDTTNSNPFNGISGTYWATAHLVDLDDDGDLDLLFGEYNGTLKYHKNNGSSTSPSFASTPQINPFGLQPGYYVALITSGDLDNDGDVDLLIGEYYGNMKYYRNTEINIGIDEDFALDFKIYPNPANDRIMIDAGYQVPKKADVLDLNGRILLTSDYLSEGIDVSSLPAGVYFLQLTSEQDEIGNVRFMKQ